MVGFGSDNPLYFRRIEMGEFIALICLIVSAFITVIWLNDRRSYPTGLQVVGALFAFMAFNTIVMGLVT